jgi:hypothetical protein
MCIQRIVVNVSFFLPFSISISATRAMKDYKLKLRNLRVSHTLGWYNNNTQTWSLYVVVDYYTNEEDFRLVYYETMKRKPVLVYLKIVSFVFLFNTSHL